MIGELRDLETISLALTAAETGHLVLATLHTNNAIRTVNRILGVFPPNQQEQIRTMVSESLRAVISQRLVARADGNGRVAALEILVVNKAVGNLIRENKTFQIRSVLQTGGAQGMCLLDDSLADLVKNKRRHSRGGAAPRRGAAADRGLTREGRAMARIDELFQYLKDKQGSDLHLAAGLEPRIRVHGALEPVAGWPALAHDELRALLREIVSVEQWEEYTGCGDLDFAYGLEGVARFRANYLRQENGAAPSSASSPSRSSRSKS